VIIWILELTIGKLIVMEFLPLILTVASVHLLAVISPGPDFLMITRNSLVYSRRTGIYSAIGLGLGILVHVAYSLIGIGLIISQSILIFSLIKILGAAYLIYIGYKSLRSKPSEMKVTSVESKADLPRLKAIKIGFLTNVLNPKATLFFLSLFTLVITPQTPLYLKLFMGIEMGIATFIWFAFIAYVFSHHYLKSKIAKVQHIAEKFIGAVLIGLGIKVALSTSK
jgi:RhtB (resistance to homoserine/threonine) family protein